MTCRRETPRTGRSLGRALVVAYALGGAAAPAALVAQPSILLGGGVTQPVRALGDVAEAGYHGTVGVQLGIPTLPVALRLDGAYHRLGAAESAVERTTVLAGAVDVVFQLPGVGLGPYVLAGAGRSRVRAGAAGEADSRFDNGFQLGFGIDLGSLAFGGFAEIRYVHVGGPDEATDFIPLTFGVRF